MISSFSYLRDNFSCLFVVIFGFNMFSKILVAIDGSENSRRAAEVSASLEELSKSKVTLLSVIYIPPMYRSDLGPELVDLLIEDAKKALDSVKPLFEKCETKIVRNIRPSEAICKEAEKEYDLIIMGSRGLGKPDVHTLGSVSDEVLHNAPCSVLIVKD